VNRVVFPVARRRGRPADDEAECGTTGVDVALALFPSEDGGADVTPCFDTESALGVDVGAGADAGPGPLGGKVGGGTGAEELVAAFVTFKAGVVPLLFFPLPLLGVFSSASKGGTYGE